MVAHHGRQFFAHLVGCLVDPLDGLLLPRVDLFQQAELMLLRCWTDEVLFQTVVMVNDVVHGFLQRLPMLVRVPDAEAARATAACERACVQTARCTRVLRSSQGGHGGDVDDNCASEEYEAKEQHRRRLLSLAISRVYIEVSSC